MSKLLFSFSALYTQLAFLILYTTTFYFYISLFFLIKGGAKILTLGVLNFQTTDPVSSMLYPRKKQYIELCYNIPSQFPC